MASFFNSLFESKKTEDKSMVNKIVDDIYSLSSDEKSDKSMSEPIITNISDTVTPLFSYDILKYSGIVALIVGILIIFANIQYSYGTIDTTSSNKSESSQYSGESSSTQMNSGGSSSSSHRRSNQSLTREIIEALIRLFTQSPRSSSRSSQSSIQPLQSSIQPIQSSSHSSIQPLQSSSQSYIQPLQSSIQSSIQPLELSIQPLNLSIQPVTLSDIQSLEKLNQDTYSIQPTETSSMYGGILSEPIESSTQTSSSSSSSSNLIPNIEGFHTNQCKMHMLKGETFQEKKINYVPIIENFESTSEPTSEPVYSQIPEPVSRGIPDLILALIEKIFISILVFLKILVNPIIVFINYLLKNPSESVESQIYKNTEDKYSKNISEEVNVFKDKMEKEKNDIANKHRGELTYCFIGLQPDHLRHCIELGVNDECMSGDIFPSMEQCINPK